MYTQFIAQSPKEEKSKKIRLNWKALFVMFPFALGIALYFTLTSNSPKDDPDQHIKIKQSNSENIPYFYVSTYEDCGNELTLSIDNITSSFELPNHYPFGNTKCERAEITSYSYLLQEPEQNMDIFSLYKQSVIIGIKTIYQYQEYTEVTFELFDGTILGYSEKIQYSPAWFVKTKQGQMFAFLINTSSKILTQLADSLLVVKVYGGKINIKFFLDEEPERIIKAFHRYMGGYRLFSIWSLGHQYYGKWVEKADLVYLNSEGIPLEALWIDEKENDYIPNDYHILKISKPTLKLGVGNKKYLIKANNGSYVGCIDGQLVNYLDYNVPYAINREESLYSMDKYSGVILKGMENFKIGQDGHCLEKISIDQNAYHQSQKFFLFENKVTEQYFHPLNSFAQQKQYHDYNNSELIISEQTFFGSGQFSGYISSSEQIISAISELIYSNFFGIPYFGSYGCDQGASPLKLCSRWLSIQAWMPLFFSYSSKKIRFQNHPEYFQQIKNEAVVRQQLTRWIFTQFIKNYDSSINNLAGTIVQPIWWYNTSDTKAFEFESREFIFGHDIIVIPIIDDPVNEYFSSYSVYFPKGSSWMQTTQIGLYQGGTEIEFNITTSISTPIFQREGSIIFRQESAGLKIDEMNNIYQLYAFFQRKELEGRAEGQMITLTDLSDQNVHNKCFGQQKNCLMNISIRYECNDIGNSEHYYLNAQGLNSETIFESVKISSIYLYHSKLHWTYEIHFQSPLIIDASFKKEYDLKQNIFF